MIVFIQLGIFVLFIFISKYLHIPESEKGFWIKSIFSYISCFIYLKLWLIFLPLGIVILIYLLNKKTVLNRKLKLTVIAFGLISFLCITVLPNYTMNAINLKESVLTGKDEEEINNTAYQYYQYLETGDIYHALLMFSNVDDNIGGSLMDNLLNSKNKLNTWEEFKSNISLNSRMSVMQRMITNKEYQILYTPSKEDLKQVIKQSPNIYYYYCNLRIKYLREECLIGECIYMKKIKGTWKIVNIQSTDRYLPYRAGIYDCRGE